MVVDKLLVGFDAPPCTYLYIDKSMQDHGLFQAICPTNRLDGDDKDFGYIVDYKDLFKKVENAIAVYTSELDRCAGGADPEVLIHDRLKKGKERLDNGLEAIALLLSRRRTSWSTSTTSAATRRHRRILPEREPQWRIAELAKNAEAGKGEDTPGTLNTPGKRALYNNPSQNQELALRIDEMVKQVRPDGWRSVEPRERVIKRVLFDVLKDEHEVERIFPIIKAQREY